MRKVLFILFFISAFDFFAVAQSINVSGTVTSSTDNQPMPFVTVAAQGTTNASTTGIDGKYSLKNISATDTLIFSFVGYHTQKVAVGSQQTINVVMHQNLKELSEVVVTALGVSRQKRELGYSTEKIDGKEIQLSNTPNVLNAITGKAAGVQITNPDGVDGGTTRITIRGNNSIDGNNQPLIVIDGIPIDNDPGMTDVGRGRDWGSAINNINMQDVEDINILKGGAASALYGSRGANGVVLITMKKGKKQKGIGVDYSMSYKITHPYRYRDVQNKYGGGAPDTSVSVPTLQYDADGNYVMPSLATDPTFGYPGTSVSWGPVMNGERIRWWDGSFRNWSPQPNNLKIPFRDGTNFTNSVAVDGAGDVGTMRFSITRTDNTPIVYNSNYNQTTLYANSTMKVSDKVNLGLSASYALYHRLNSPMLGEEENSFNKGLLYSFPRSYQGEDNSHYELADGTRNQYDGNVYPYQYVNKYLWWNYYNNNTTLDRGKLIGALTFNYAITNWLSFTTRTGMDFTSDEYQTKNKPADVIGLLDGYYEQTLQRDKSINADYLFTARKDSIFKSHFNVDLSFGGASWSRDMQSVRARSGTWYYPNLYSLGNFTPATYGQDSSGQTIVINQGDVMDSLTAKTNFYRKKINSLYGFLNLSYKNYLFIQLTGRNDWSSTLPAGANSYFYPGISVSYVLSDALKFTKGPVSFCKLRGGASQTATDTDPYRTEFYYSTSLYGGQQSSNYPPVIPPLSLKPQRVNDYEVGTSLGFLKDYIMLDFTYYYKYAFDQIINTPLPLSAGAGFATINNGVLTNEGFEILLSATVLQKNNFTFKTGLNFARNRNTVVSLGDYNHTYPLKDGDIWGNNGPKIALHEGDDFGTITGWDYVYKDGKRVVNADGTQYLIPSTQTPIGNASPDFLAGWTTEFRYKSITLRTLIDTKWGGDIYCGSYVTGLQTGQSPETLKERDGGGLPYTDSHGNTTNTGVILDGVHEDGTPNTTVVHYIWKYMPNDGGWGHFISKAGIVEDTWVKFREVTLSYDFPSKLIKKLKIFQALSLSFTGRDLFYIYSSVPDNINPEGTLGAGDAQGIEWGALPGVRSFTFGLNAKF